MTTLNWSIASIWGKADSMSKLILPEVPHAEENIGDALPPGLSQRKATVTLVMAVRVKDSRIDLTGNPLSRPLNLT